MSYTPQYETADLHKLTFAEPNSHHTAITHPVYQDQWSVILLTHLYTHKQDLMQILYLYVNLLMIYQTEYVTTSFFYIHLPRCCFVSLLCYRSCGSGVRKLFKLFGLSEDSNTFQSFRNICMELI